MFWNLFQYISHSVSQEGYKTKSMHFFTIYSALMIYMYFCTQDPIREPCVWVLWSDLALFLTSKEYKWWALHKYFLWPQVVPVLFGSLNNISTVTFLHNALFRSGKNEYQPSSDQPDHQVCGLFYELLKCNILSSLEQEEAKSAKSFRAASCKKSIRKN